MASNQLLSKCLDKPAVSGASRITVVGLSSLAVHGTGIV